MFASAYCTVGSAQTVRATRSGRPPADSPRRPRTSTHAHAMNGAQNVGVLDGKLLHVRIQAQVGDAFRRPATNVTLAGIIHQKPAANPWHRRRCVARRRVPKREWGGGMAARDALTAGHLLQSGRKALQTHGRNFLARLIMELSSMVRWFGAPPPTAPILHRPQSARTRILAGSSLP
jgi:hypothetical protein